CLQYNTSPFTF
nr:immunoglobulin light chain junction region [Macaca mulatta]MOW09993.1 immunoglobulin light chain junction region [Macaca mulatta]MOW11216.1 immunoglobulin light chain junction region [Macaca mulatta]MOW13070.1 immunoglobulin light chain junction region [Macaca mulatta]MOW14219.1 immunoglobulin light chain junction region [Macaca mulatta]